MLIDWQNVHDRARRYIRVYDKKRRKIMQEMERKLGRVDGVGASGLLSRSQLSLLSLVEFSLLLNRCGTTSSLAGYLSCTDVYNF